MSVLKNQRDIPEDSAYYYGAIQLRKEFTLLLLRDFGVKNKERNPNFYAKMNHMEAEDAQTMFNIMEKYGMGSKVLEEFPDWLIEWYRSDMLKTIERLHYFITMADSIQTPSSRFMCERRQAYQQDAVGCCKHLLQIMQATMYVLPVNAEKLMPYVEMIEDEIDLIRNWRKKCNKDFKRFPEYDASIYSECDE